MNKLQLMRFVASDNTGILRDEDSHLGYFIKRMWYKLIICLS